MYSVLYDNNKIWYVLYTEYNVNVYVRLTVMYPYTAKLGYNDMGFCDTSPRVSDILWYKLIL